MRCYRRIGYASAAADRDGLAEFISRVWPRRRRLGGAAAAESYRGRRMSRVIIVACRRRRVSRFRRGCTRRRRRSSYLIRTQHLEKFAVLQINNWIFSIKARVQIAARLALYPLDFPALFGRPLLDLLRARVANVVRTSRRSYRQI